MHKKHQYSLNIKWTGNTGKGTSEYRGYERSHKISAENRSDILCSSDPVFLGDKTRYNPEELFVASISSCHMLWYLHLCAEAGVVVLDYSDNPIGTLVEAPNGSGHFIEVALHPDVTVEDKSMLDKANELHNKAHEFCFIANSCNFKIKYEQVCKIY
jgi:organic hydroperoxide reductase OsmC/OhrA